MWLWWYKRMLGSNNPSKREYAAKTLGGFSGKKAVELLIEALCDNESPVRVAAVLSLGQLGDSCAIEPLIKALENEDVYRFPHDVLVKKLGQDKAAKQIRDSRIAMETMIKTLCSFADKQAIKPLIKKLVDYDPCIRQLAAESLSELGESKWRQLVHGSYTDFERLSKSGDSQAAELLLYALTKGHLADQEHLIEAVSKLGDSRAVTLLIPMLNTKWSVLAARVLGELGDKRAVVHLIKALEQPYCAAAAAYALADLGDRQAVEPLIKSLGHSYAAPFAAEALGKIGDSRAFVPLLKVLGQEMESECPQTRESIIAAFGQLGDMRAVEPLIKMLGSHNSGIRMLSAQALSKLGQSKWLQCVKGKEDDFWHLGLSQDPAAIQPLLAALDGPETSLREIAVKGLGQTRDQRALEPLLKMLRVPEIRGSDAEALGELGDLRAEDDLIQLLNDSNIDVRKNAAIALGKLCSRKAIPYLKKILIDTDWFVRKSSADSLYKLGEKDSRLDEVPIPTMKVLSHCYGPMGLERWECLGMCLNCARPFIFNLYQTSCANLPVTCRQHVYRYECDCGYTLYATLHREPFLANGCRVVDGKLKLEIPVKLILEKAGNVIFEGNKLPKRAFWVDYYGNDGVVMQEIAC